MADAYFIVTLSSTEGGSGPNYNAFYSTDCNSYTASIPSSITLENVGSQATITVPDNTQCIKLTSVNSNCDNSIIVSGITTTTTTAAPTTTTTAAPTTTTTTTTAAPTTTTAAPTLYSHGVPVGVCTSYCDSNYLIQTATYATGTYLTLTIGDTIDGQGGVAGYVAYSDQITDTNTGPFKIAEIDEAGVVTDILVCSGGSCVPL